MYLSAKGIFADFLEPSELQRYAVRLCPLYYNAEE
jgi:hypothetical protein